MKIATWNVNSMKVRLPVALEWIKAAEPDVLCLQEIKCVSEAFPREAFEDAGYNCLIKGQKTYNGVALLSKRPAELVMDELPGDKADEQARYLEAIVEDDAGPVTVATIYLPNGNPTGTEKYDYKLKWMDRLIKRAKKLLESEEPVVLAGDYNVIPEAGDVHDPKAWENDALFLLETRRKFRELLYLGYTDALRACHAEAGLYTFWDYQAGAWTKNNGIRIDHLLLSPQAVDRLEGVTIEKEVRGWEKPSDHVPVMGVL